MRGKLFITKASGDRAPYDPGKLIHSLLRAGASKTEAEAINKQLSAQLYEGISTKKIYSIAFNLLKKKSLPAADRYKLKKGIMELGPEGFAFEKLVSRILQHEGYTTQVGNFIEGKCVRHEVDILAEKDHHLVITECKYHNLPGTMCDVKVPLYINSRFADILEAWKISKTNTGKTIDGWIATNTKFTADAIKYGTCAGLKLMGWNYPAKGNINQKIDEYGLYPITCLTSLTRKEKQFLLAQNIILCQELKRNTGALEEAGIQEDKIKFVLEESENLCRELKKNGKAGK
jgi:hypothetical protein